MRVKRQNGVCKRQHLLAHAPIEAAILNRLGEMLLADMLGSIEIGDGACNLEDAGVAAGGEAEALGNKFEQAVAGFVRLAMFANEACRHLGVAVDAAVVEAIFLDGAAGFDSAGNDFRGFGVGTIDEITILHCRDFDLDVDAVKQGAGDLGTVALNDHRRTGTGVGRVGQIAAGTALRVPFPTFLMNASTDITSQFH